MPKDVNLQMATRGVGEGGGNIHSRVIRHSLVQMWPTDPRRSWWKRNRCCGSPVDCRVWTLASESVALILQSGRSCPPSQGQRGEASVSHLAADILSIFSSVSHYLNIVLMFVHGQHHSSQTHLENSSGANVIWRLHKHCMTFCELPTVHWILNPSQTVQQNSLAKQGIFQRQIYGSLTAFAKCTV